MNNKTLYCAIVGLFILNCAVFSYYCSQNTTSIFEGLTTATTITKKEAKAAAKAAAKSKKAAVKVAQIAAKADKNAARTAAKKPNAQVVAAFKAANATVIDDAVKTAVDKSIVQFTTAAKTAVAESQPAVQTVKETAAKAGFNNITDYVLAVVAARNPSDPTFGKYDNDPNRELAAVAFDNYEKAFTWRGTGALPLEDTPAQRALKDTQMEWAYASLRSQLPNLTQEETNKAFSDRSALWKSAVAQARAIDQPKIDAVLSAVKTSDELLAKKNNMTLYEYYYAGKDNQLSRDDQDIYNQNRMDYEQVWDKYGQWRDNQGFYKGPG